MCAFEPPNSLQHINRWKILWHWLTNLAPSACREKLTEFPFDQVKVRIKMRMKSIALKWINIYLRKPSRRSFVPKMNSFCRINGDWSVLHLICTSVAPVFAPSTMKNVSLNKKQRIIFMTRLSYRIEDFVWTRINTFPLNLEKSISH